MMAAAHAMQVLAGALKDNGRARIVGERTFGKGLIQTIVELSDGSGVAVTVARYQTPAGTDINKVRVNRLVRFHAPCRSGRHARSLPQGNGVTHVGSGM